MTAGYALHHSALLCSLHRVLLAGTRAPNARMRSTRRQRYSRSFKSVTLPSSTTVMDTSSSRQQEFHDLALRWLPDVSRYAQSLTRDTTAAEDLLQETYLNAWRHWRTFIPGSEPRAWLFTIARNAWRKRAPRDARMIAVEEQTLQALSDAEHPLAASTDITRQLASLDLGPAITQAISELPEVFREVVQLVELQELSYAEASAVLNIPIGTVRSRLFRARRLLQTALLNHAQDAGFVSANEQEPR